VIDKRAARRILIEAKLEVSLGSANRPLLDLGSAAQTATFASDLDAVMRSVYDTASCAPQLRWMIVFLSV
jgi:hypothetical protein